MSRWLTIEIEGVSYKLAHIYQNYKRHTVDYSVFRDRVKTYCKKLETHPSIQHDQYIFLKAMFYSQSNWMKIIGIGKAKPFKYLGKLHIGLYGVKYLCMPHFLSCIQSLSKHELVQSRLKQNMHIDIALSQPKFEIKNGVGDVYIVENLVTNQLYVGITTIGPERRFAQHKNGYKPEAKASLLRESIKKCGRDKFKLIIVATNLSTKHLKLIEVSLIELFNTRWPSGLNGTSGGELNQRQGNACKVLGKPFRSVSEAGRYVERHTNGNVKSYVAERCIRDDLPLPIESRQVSKHADAGTILYRKYRALFRKGSLCQEWTDYDEFVKGTLLNGITLQIIVAKNLILFRQNKEEPYGPNNFEWLSKGEERAKSTGNSFLVHGRTFYGLASLARQFGIAESTLRYRVNKMNLPVHIAIKQS